MKTITSFIKNVSNRVALILFLSVSYCQSAGLLSVEVASNQGSGSYLYLIQHSNIWHYRYGTNAPQANWKTVSDSLLDNTWLTGPAGFGYEDGDDATVINSMSNRFTTLYIRRTFTIDSSIDLSSQLELVIDYDDGFIAWIDGIEVARSPNAPGTVGTEPPFNSVAIPSHEALTYRGLPPEVYNLGSVGTRMQPGTHVLAIMGFNSALTSSDFSLIPDLRIRLTTNNALNGLYCSFVYNTNRVLLRGTNTVNGSTAVTVNGVQATFNPADGYWEFISDISQGMNRFFIAAFDQSGNVLASTNKYVVNIQNLNSLGGEISTNISIAGNGAVTLITNNLTVKSGATLTFEQGAVVLIDQSASVIATDGGIIRASGNDSSPVYFIPADGSTQWGAVAANGDNSFLILNNAEIIAGQVYASSGASLEVTESTLRDLIHSSRLIIGSTNAFNVLIKKSRFSNYTQIRFSSSPVTIEDSLFENVYSDGCDFADSSQIKIRNTTFRYGYGSNTDAIDLGNNPGAVIEGVLIHHFPDKAVSIAEFSHGVIVTNSLMYSNGIGISIYGSTNCIINQNTIVNNSYGLWLRQRYAQSGPGSGAGTNNIIWGNITNILATDGSVIELSYSDIQSDTVFPGAGNINSAPLFLNPDIADYSLLTNSPAFSSGYNGGSMGFLSRPGGIPAEPLNLVAIPLNVNSIILKWHDNSENEDAFQIQFSTNKIDWIGLATVSANFTFYEITNITAEVRYYFRVRAINNSGRSQFSNIASAMTSIPKIYYGGVLTTNTVWTSQSGLIIVASNLIVPTNITLTILEGASVQIAANTIIRATNGGTIIISGTFDNRVKITPYDLANVHREISAYGTNSSLIIRFAEIIGVQATVYNGAEGLLEDSYFHNYDITNGDLFTRPIVLTHFAKPVTIRRCHFKNYYELLLRNSVHTVEDCLFEYATGDCLDFDAGQPGTVVRRSTFRKGLVTNVDGIDIGNDGARYSTFLTVENCKMYDFPYDKGVSIGDGSADIVVRNCLIYNCDSGIAVKDECTATIYNCTIISNNYGINLKAKYPAQYQGGRATNTFNNIIWGNTLQILVTNNPIIVVNFSDIQGTNWPGTGNISSNPLFRNPEEGDFRLLPDSPAIGSGSNGMTMGVIFPIGGLPDIPQNFRIISNSIDSVILSWEPPTNYYTGFIIERSVNNGGYIKVGETGGTNFFDSLTAPGANYSYRICATNFIGNSFYTEELNFRLADKPIIISSPTDVIVDEGGTASFAVIAEAIGGATFQWYFNNSPIQYATNQILVLTNVSSQNTGEYFAVVFDRYGNFATSGVGRLIIHRQNVAIDVSNIILENGAFKIRINSQPEKTYILQASSNLTTWTPVYTNNGSGLFIELIDNSAYSHDRRFYRVVVTGN